jgi:hypothetical protein
MLANATGPKAGTHALEISKLRIDGGTQRRAQLNETVWAVYGELVAEGLELPLAVAFFDGEHYWLADGFHRRLGY